MGITRRPTPRSEWPDILTAGDLIKTGIFGQDGAYKFVEKFGLEPETKHGTQKKVVEKETVWEYLDGDKLYEEAFEKAHPHAAWESDEEPCLPVVKVIASDEGGELAYEKLPDGRVKLIRVTGSWLNKVKFSKLPAILKPPYPPFLK